MLIAKKLITTQERDVTTRRLRHCIVTSHDNQSQRQYMALYYVNVKTSKEIGIKCCSCFLFIQLFFMETAYNLSLAQLAL